MTDIDVPKLAADMLAAGLSVLKAKGPEVGGYAATEFKKIAEAIFVIQNQYKAGQMNEEQARLQFRIQKNASKAVLLTVEGLTDLAVEAAINAALMVAQATVNTAIGFVLL